MCSTSFISIVLYTEGYTQLTPFHIHYASAQNRQIYMYRDVLLHVLENGLITHVLAVLVNLCMLLVRLTIRFASKERTGDYDKK